MSKNIVYIGIDPGKTGALAILYPDGTLAIEGLETDTIPSLMDQIKQHALSASMEEFEIMCMVEDAVQNIQQAPNALPDHIKRSIFRSATKLAHHCGVLDAALEAAGIEFDKVTPNNWMTHVVPGRPKGTKNKDARKKYIRDVMLFKYAPKIKKLAIGKADALGVLDYLLTLKEVSDDG